MNVSTATTGDQHKVTLSGRFDFSAHKEFRQGYDPVLGNAGVRSLVVDLSGVDYVDSAALGMLLLMQERATAANKQVVLLEPQGTAKQVLEVANFHKLCLF
jgi:HptB-dependent secretion and biofilm anti anti-sigma factor